MRKYHQKQAEQDPLYKYEPWQITEEEFKVSTNHHNETIFALGNGYMGVRGTLEEDYTGPAETTTPGIYINGVYGSEKIIYGEEAPDLPEMGQTILNLADWTSINLYLDGEKFDMLSGEINDYRRILDMKKGTLTRELIWTSPGGKTIRLTILRFLSMVDQHLGVINYKLTPLNFSGDLKLISAVDGDVENCHHLRNRKILEVDDRGFMEKKGYIMQQAKSTGMDIITVMQNILSVPDCEVHSAQKAEEKRIFDQFQFTVANKKEYSLTKYVVLYSSRDIADQKKLLNEAVNYLDQAVEAGWEKLLEEHKNYLSEYWNDVDFKIYGDLSLQQGFRFNAFHLLQSTGRDGQTNIAAKGLTGEFYEGHYFWDTETYILPFFLYGRPDIAKNLLIYRYNTLDQARANARRMKLDGALFAWRTINGEEASGFFMGSTIQYHIDADIAFAFYQYFWATEDYDFIFNYGVEILIETARMWASLGSYIPMKDNKFCINEVCGPDEYKPGVNNNCYTNYMAKFNLEFTVDMIKLMAEKVPDQFNKLKDRVELKKTELKSWEEMAREMYLPYNEQLGIHPQDDSFLYKEPIDIDQIPEEEIPLVTNWHPLIIWRYQVIKQADVILLMLLQNDKFSLTEKKANYDYYEPRTTHDSSLSPAIYSIIASEIGYFNKAYNYFIQTVRLDLDDYNKNAYQGVHTACMAGSWLALVQGFAGMRNYKGQLSFNPYLPEQWEGYEFKVKYRGRQIKVEVKQKGVSYMLLAGKELTILDRGQEKKLKGLN